MTFSFGPHSVTIHGGSNYTTHSVGHSYAEAYRAGMHRSADFGVNKQIFVEYMKKVVALNRDYPSFISANYRDGGLHIHIEQQGFEIWAGRLTLATLAYRILKNSGVL